MFGRQPAADILKDRGISRETAARTIGVKHSILNNTLAGRQTPSQQVRDGLVKLLDLPLEQLFTAEPLSRTQGKRYRQGAMISLGEDPTIRHTKKRGRRAREENEAKVTEDHAMAPTEVAS